jgi:ArsR family transcriptional regulator, arsenate/arsenite/antimonite-responsive transcriptional repressor
VTLVVMTIAGIGIGIPCGLKFRSEPGIKSNGTSVALRARINAAAAGSAASSNGCHTLGRSFRAFSNPDIHYEGLFFGTKFKNYPPRVPEVLSSAWLKLLIAALAALAQESRLDIFRLLVQAGPDGIPAGQIGERLGLPSATLSFHLNQLRHAGLVTFRRESRSLIYAAEYAAMNELLAYLTENCCQGDASSCDAGACDSSTLINAKKGTPANEAPASPRVR